MTADATKKIAGASRRLLSLLSSLRSRRVAPEIANGDKPEGRSYDRIHAPAFMFSPRKIAHRISVLEAQSRAATRLVFVRRLRFAPASQGLRRRVYNNDDGAGRIDNGN